MPCVAYLSPDLHAWLEPVSTILYAARREQRLLLVEAHESLPLAAEIEALDGKLGATRWRALIAHEEGSADHGLERHHERLDALPPGFEPSDRWIVVLEDPSGLRRTRRYERRANQVVVRCADPRMDPIPHRGRARLAMLLLALATTKLLERGEEYVIEHAAGEERVQQIGGVELRTADDGENAHAPVASRLFARHEARLRQAKQDLEADEPKVSVSLLHEPPAGHADDFSVGRRLVGDPAQGWLRERVNGGASNWRQRWARWRDERERALAEGASSLNKRLHEAVRRAVAAVGSQHALGSTESLTQKAFHERLEREEEVFQASNRKSVALEKSFLSLLDEAGQSEGWSDVEHRLRTALEARPTRRQVIWATLIGVAALAPSAILQISTLTAAISLGAVVAVALGVVVMVARRVLKGVQGANATARARYEKRHAALEEAATKAAELVDALAKRATAARNVARLEVKRSELQSSTRMYTHHRSELSRHAGHASDLARALRVAGHGAGGTDTDDLVDRPPPLEPLDRGQPVWHNPVYSMGDLVVAQDWRQAAELAVGANQRETLEEPEFTMVRRIHFQRTEDLSPEDVTP